MEKLQRILRKNHKKSMPTHFLFLDCETRYDYEDGYQIHKMRMAWSCFINYRPERNKNSETWKFHDKPYPMWEYITSLTSTKHPLYIIGHNIFFDLQCSGFFKYLPKQGWKLRFFYDKGFVYILIIENNKRVIKCISTTNYFQATLKQLGHMVGLEKQEVDFEHCNDETLKEYCKNDVKILILSMQYYRDFIEKYDLGRFALTKSSQSMNAFRHRFMYAKIYIHDELEAKMLERLAYMGGRVECFYIGKIRDDNVITLDINSMYPYLMSTNPVPTKLVCMRENESVDNVALNLKTHLGVARVIVKTDKPIYSIQQNSKIIFPIGEFECFLCTGGLLEALKRGHLKKVLNINYYQGGIIFKDYVDFFYDLRMQAKEDGNTILDGLSKIMMNSLYGKFGARIAKLEINDSESNIEYRRISNYIVETKETFIEYYLFGKRIVETEKVDSPNSFTAISAHITEYGRLMLWDLIEQVGENRVLYCDTDCIKIRQSDIHRVKHEIHPAKLGALKIDKIDKNFEIMGCKSYRSDNVRHIKGVPIHAKEIDKTHYEYMQFGRQLKHMHKNIDMGVIVHNQIKELSGNYDKGIVTCSGAVLPFQL